jgi:hypothetical protein
VYGCAEFHLLRYAVGLIQSLTTPSQEVITQYCSIKIEQ